MSCMVSFAPQMAMATTQLAHTTHSKDVGARMVESISERKQPLSMSWVVVIDENGKRQLRMRWTADK